MPRLLDLFCGRWGWSRAFAARGWECVGVDAVKPDVIPLGCHYEYADLSSVNIAMLRAWERIYGPFDFICASSPCEQFSVHGMKHFHPKPPYPDIGIKLFEGTRSFCEWSEFFYVMENVRAAQQFVGRAVHHCGPFYLWGNAVPPLLHKGIIKGIKIGGELDFSKMTLEQRREARLKFPRLGGARRNDKAFSANAATIPPELANCVADYAERLLEQKATCGAAAHP